MIECNQLSKLIPQKKLSDKIIELKDLEDEIANAEESVKKLKEKALHLSAIEIPAK
jgi:hypothetical protein